MKNENCNKGRKRDESYGIGCQPSPDRFFKLIHVVALMS